MLSALIPEAHGSLPQQANAQPQHARNHCSQTSDLIVAAESVLPECLAG